MGVMVTAYNGRSGTAVVIARVTSSGTLNTQKSTLVASSLYKFYPGFLHAGLSVATMSLSYVICGAFVKVVCLMMGRWSRISIWNDGASQRIAASRQ